MGIYYAISCCDNTLQFKYNNSRQNRKNVSTTGLVVKSNIPIVGPWVRFPGSAVTSNRSFIFYLFFSTLFAGFVKRRNNRKHKRARNIKKRESLIWTKFGTVICIFLKCTNKERMEHNENDNIANTTATTTQQRGVMLTIMMIITAKTTTTQGCSIMVLQW